MAVICTLTRQTRFHHKEILMPQGHLSKLSRNPQRLSRIMSKSVFQSGMSWKVVENKWPGTREAFHNFDVHTVANFNDAISRHCRKTPASSATFANSTPSSTTHSQIIAPGQSAWLISALSTRPRRFDSTMKAIRKDFKFMGPSGIYVFSTSLANR